MRGSGGARRSPRCPAVGRPRKPTTLDASGATMEAAHTGGPPPLPRPAATLVCEAYAGCCGRRRARTSHYRVLSKELETS
eukprot:2806744-Pleurochrysis_carterae.AAC.4